MFTARNAGLSKRASAELDGPEPNANGVRCQCHNAGCLLSTPDTASGVRPVMRVADIA